MSKVNCNNCSGTGYIHAFAHVAGGQCFTCEGSGKVDGGRKQQYNFPTATIEEAKEAVNDDYKWECFQQKFNQNPREFLKSA